MFTVNYGIKEREFSDILAAEKYARRCGAGAKIYEGGKKVKCPVLLAEINRKSAHRPDGLVTDLTWEGGKYL